MKEARSHLLAAQLLTEGPTTFAALTVGKGSRGEDRRLALVTLER
jgi:hypothetical protein